MEQQHKTCECGSRNIFLSALAEVESVCVFFYFNCWVLALAEAESVRVYLYFNLFGFGEEI